ncbi:MAG TPA: peptidoglycan DD-metalloendopeptidase family protein [Rhodopila sp.]|nr:peptidoglycan DD-metalloendopeptidase family protein [Rhodopila sp.]
MTVSRILAALLAVAPATSLAASSKEADTARALQDAERQNSEQLAARQDAADRAAKAAARAQFLAQQQADSAAKLRQAEAATSDVATRMDALAAQRHQAEQRLQAHAAALQPLLPLIERLSLYPAETLLAVPAPADSALRGVLVLQGLSRQIEIEAEALRHDQEDIDAATAALRQNAPQLAQAEAEQKRQADALDQQIADAHAEQQAAEAQANQAATQAADAASRMDSLRAALTALDAQRRADEAKAREEAARADRQKNAAAAQAARSREAVAAHPTGPGAIAAAAGPHGQLQPPVIGVVVRAWGDQTDAGPATGLSYHAPPSARVISPCGGRVVFAQSFRSYGLLLIIDCGGGYNMVLAGFDHLDVKLGQSLVAGAPVGVMPGWEPGSDAHRPSLYVELRHDGTPVNPTPWLRPST